MPTPYSRRSQILRALHCIVVYNGMGFPDCQIWKVTSQSGKNIKRYPIGYFHIDIAELRINEGKLYLFVAIDRTSKFAAALLVDKANRKTS